MKTSTRGNHNPCMDAGTGHGFLMDQHIGGKLTDTAMLEEEAIKDWG